MKKKYFIQYDISGIGHMEESYVEEFDTQEEADEAAYESAREQFENSSCYSARELTKELAEEFGLEWNEEEKAAKAT